MAKRRAVRCRKCKAVLSEDGRMIPLECPECGADTDDVNMQFLPEGVSEGESWRVGGGHALFSELLRHFPIRTQIAILIGVVGFFTALLIWLMVWALW